MTLESSFRKRLREAIESVGRKAVYGDGISEGGLSKVVSGDVKNPGIFTVKAMAKACGVTVGWLLEEPPFAAPEHLVRSEYRAHIANLEAIDASDREMILVLVEKYAAALGRASAPAKSRRIVTSRSKEAETTDRKRPTDERKPPIGMP